MNFDINTIATLMQLLNADKPGNSTENNACNAQKTVSTQSVDKSSVQNAFYAQNGIGEQVRIDFSQNKPKSPLDMLDTGQNPMLSMLKSLNTGKGDMSAILPMIMSLMQKQTQKSTKSEQADINAQNIDTSDGNCTQKSKTDENINAKSAENGVKSDKQKTQRDVFEPVAFAGYEVVSTLAALLTAVRRPCR